MACFNQTLWIFCLFTCLLAAPERLNSNEADAIAFLEGYNADYTFLLNNDALANWNYQTNMTNYNLNKAVIAKEEADKYYAEASLNATQFDTTAFSQDTKRQLSYLSYIHLNQAETEELNAIIKEMESIYSNFMACRTNEDTLVNECMHIEPELNELMAKLNNQADHLWAWQTWHDGVGRRLRPLYLRYVELSNKRARLNGYTDTGDQWRQRYETTQLESIVQNLYSQVEPLYKQLHAYVRRQLYKFYGPDQISLRGTLPGHLLGDMWGRSWIHLNPAVQPYPDKPTMIDPIEEMINQNYTAEYMFRIGNETLTASMGLLSVPELFWNKSMLEKPTDGRQVDCQATAQDFYDGLDYRIRMCAQVSFEDFQAAHYQLSQIQYFMQYANQPLNYRNEANDVFFEAVGEIMSMSFSSTKHLKSLGLIESDFPEDPDVDINFLLLQALNTVATLPFHLVQDTWRWSMFRNEIPVEELNDNYWAEKARVVGVSRPIERDPNRDLDITGIYEVVADTDMIRYFLRPFFQYQFHQALCQVSGHNGPVYKCDFYNSVAAGDKLEAMMKLGSSVPWQDAMEVMTGQRDVLATPLLNYFEPLRVWLEAKNAENGEYIGWD